MYNTYQILQNDSSLVFFIQKQDELLGGDISAQKVVQQKQHEITTAQVIYNMCRPT
jgi:hypothetical protein